MLLEQGATVNEIRHAAALGQRALSALSTALAVYPPPRIEVNDALKQTNVSEADMRVWWHHIGWPDPTRPGSKVNDYDLRLMEILRDRFPMGILPGEVIADYLRTTSASVADIAESMLNTLRIGLDQPARARGDSVLEMSRAHRTILDLLLPDFFEALTILFRHAVIAGASAEVTVNRGGEVWSERTMVFVDLVDYTALAQGGSLRELLDEFETTVAGCATDYGGRLVKLLGDGAMLTFTSRDAGISAATALVRDTALPPCRAGVATGEVMMRHADYFGPVVNLASRLSSVVDAGEVAVDDSVAVATGRPMEPTALKGIHDRVTPYRISR
jgi:adenylate cyclase